MFPARIELVGVTVALKATSASWLTGVIMVSAFTRRGADVTIKALQAGAFDFVTKPSGGTPETNRAVLRSALEPVVRAFTRRCSCGRGVATATPTLSWGTFGIGHPGVRRRRRDSEVDAPLGMGARSYVPALSLEHCLW